MEGVSLRCLPLLPEAAQRYALAFEAEDGSVLEFIFHCGI